MRGGVSLRVFLRRASMTGKERMVEILATLADDATWEEILDAVRLELALEDSKAALERGEVVPHEDVFRGLTSCETTTSK